MVLTAPVTAVELDPHADGAAMRTVRYETYFGCPDRRLQVIFLLQVRVRIALENL